MSDKRELPTVGGGPGGERCETCRWWAMWDGPEIYTKPEDHADVPSLGTCHRHAPRPRAFIDPNAQDTSLPTDWPNTGGDDWCGEWKAMPSPPAKRRTWKAYKPPVIHDSEMRGWLPPGPGGWHTDEVYDVAWRATLAANTRLKNKFRSLKGDCRGYWPIWGSIIRLYAGWLRIERDVERRRTPTLEAVRRVLAAEPDDATLIAALLAEDDTDGLLSKRARAWLEKMADAKP